MLQGLSRSGSPSVDKQIPILGLGFASGSGPDLDADTGSDLGSDLSLGSGAGPGFGIGFA